MKPKTPIPVLFLITELSIGGAQMALFRLLQHLDRKIYEPSVACWYNGDAEIAQKIRALNIPVFDLGMTKKVRWDAFFKLWLLIRQIQPAILHTWMFHANIPGRLIGKIARVPVIISSERTMGQEGRFRRVLNRMTSFGADAITCVSRQVGEYAVVKIGINPQKIIIVPNGIALNQFDDLPSQVESRARFDLPNDAIIVGAVGRPRPVKGFDRLIHAFGAIAAQFPQAVLLFIGDGPDRPLLEKLSLDLGIQPRVIFLGDQTAISSLLPAMDLLVNSSAHEGMSNVILEAMAAGLPVVATAVGGTPEVVAAGETGILVPPDDLQALAAALLTLIENPELRRKMGRAGRERVETHFRLDQTLSTTQNLYHRLLAEKGIHL